MHTKIDLDIKRMFWLVQVYIAPNQRQIYFHGLYLSPSPSPQIKSYINISYEIIPIIYQNLITTHPNILLQRAKIHANQKFVPL